ncbi:hypothetical protein [Nitrosospira briensis]|uniref:hypothetical protein n=1 Tax=Nitrosospira briensis TaxID=35799 RepID=UPI0011606D8B|nr:hypothetical protein [Nitrosospira briensis]
MNNLLNMPIPLSTLSNFAETRMDKGFHKDAQLSTLSEHLGTGKLQGTSGKIFTCGGQVREKTLVTRTAWGGHLGAVCMVNMVVVRRES